MTASLSQKNHRILVIDDNDAIHTDFRKILLPADALSAELAAAGAALFGETERPAVARAAFTMDSAHSGEEGLALVEAALVKGLPYALAFVDVRMAPGWNGIETTARICQADPDIQIVICTAYSDYSWEEMIEQLGHSDRLVILKKPFDTVEVLQLAHSLTEKWDLGLKARLRTEQLEEMVTARTLELQLANERLKVEMAERARTEDVLRQSQKMEALGQLAGGIAHDFNNLLTVIRGYVECLNLHAVEKPGMLAELQQIDIAAERAAKLTTQMLMFSRKQRLQPLSLNLNELITNFATMLYRVLGENIAVELQCDTTPLMILADPVMIEMVLLNLGVNARDAMPSGGRLLIRVQEIVLTAADLSQHSHGRPGTFAHVRVTDTGCGIAPAALAHIFEPFYTTKEVGKGTGLGLATVYGVVKQHEGWVEVASQPGHGTTFEIFLPGGVKKPAPSTPPPLKPSVLTGTETILLVEDEPVVRRLAKTLLERHGYRVYDAGSGAEALAIWAAHAPEIELLLTDVIMPGSLTGRDLAKHLHAEKNSLKIIYTTGYSRDAIGPDVELIDGLNFLPKPYPATKLIQTARRCLDAASNRNESARAAE
jgi:signal transduction histidine kinase